MTVSRLSLSMLVGLGLLPAATAIAQLEPISANDRTTTTSQDPNPKNPVRPPHVNTGVGSPDTPTDSLLNEGSPPLGGEAAARTGDPDTQALPPQGFNNNFGFAGGTMQTLRLTDLLNADLQLNDGQAAGTISDVVLGPNGSILYLIGTDTAQQNLFTVPVSAASFDAGTGIITLPMTPQQFGNLPTYTRETIPNFNSLAYQRQLYTAYGLAGVRVNPTANAVNQPANNAAAVQNRAGVVSRPNAGRVNPSSVQPPNAELPAPGSSAAQRNVDATGSTSETKRATVGNPAGVGNQSLPGAASRAAAKTPAGTPKTGVNAVPGAIPPAATNPAARNNATSPSQRNQLRTPPLNLPVQGNNSGQPAAGAPPAGAAAKAAGGNAPTTPK
jgi:hypothetical protein